jgi:hypothetical protein
MTDAQIRYGKMQDSSWIQARPATFKKGATHDPGKVRTDKRTHFSIFILDFFGDVSGKEIGIE